MSPSPRRRYAHEINVVPYIDVMLVLLVIFMITAPLLQQGVEVELPQASAEALPADKDAEPLVVSVDAQGQRYLNRGAAPEEPLTDDELIRLLQTALKAQPGLPVVVEGDRRASYEQIMQAMALLQGAGVRQVGLATQPG